MNIKIDCPECGGSGGIEGEKEEGEE